MSKKKASASEGGRYTRLVMDQKRRGYDRGKLECDGDAAEEDNELVADWPRMLSRGAKMMEMKAADGAEEFSVREVVKRSSGVAHGRFVLAVNEGASLFEGVE